jgi:hypothetical protein
VLFRALDTPADVARVLGLEVTFAVIDEFREIPKPIIESLAGRLGRFKPPGDVGCTNYGMWGASNPGTEDVWWYDYLHGKRNAEGQFRGCVQVKFPHDEAAQRAFEQFEGVPEGANAWYFRQPSGFAPDAENIEHLPKNYYKNLAKDRSIEWIKQFIEAEWGFSISGKAVIQTFRPDLHVAKEQLRFNQYLPLVVGLDPGLGGAALIFMQQDLLGRLSVLGEIVTQGKSAMELMALLRAYVRARFPNAQVLLAPDPAAAIRSANDKKAIVDTLRQFYQVSIETNNRLPLRLEAINYFATKLVDGVPALQIDPVHCPVLLRALKGGWRYAIDVKKEEIKGAEPEKNQWSHPGDAFGYGARYFHRGALREERQGNRPFTPPRFSDNPYHIR